ncbi:MAG: hypothetical protein KAS32_07645 [Candidatus Peribacteraceae bacterium]|nr:hypothetical protein [Candidatus Peribacteraceae bacterium]
MNFYVDIIKDEPVEFGRKWRVALKSCSTGKVIMKGTSIYRYKGDANSMKKELEQALKG